MSTDTAARTIDLRLCLRKLRNLCVTLLMIAAFVQAFGVPRLRSDSATVSLRLVRLERPVWEHVQDAASFLWSHFLQEVRI